MGILPPPKGDVIAPGRNRGQGIPTKENVQERKEKRRGGKRLPPSRRNGKHRLNSGGRRFVGAGTEEAATECRPPEDGQPTY